MTRPRITLAAAVVAVAIGGVVVALGPSYASFPASTGLLTSPEAQTNIEFSNGTFFAFAPDTVNDESWSADGSRVAATDWNTVWTARYNDKDAGNDAFEIAPAESNVWRNHVTWSGDGETVFWSQQTTPLGAWQLEAGSSTGAYDPFQVSPPNDGHDYTNADPGPGTTLAVQVDAAGTGGYGHSGEIGEFYVCIRPTDTPTVDIFDYAANSWTPAISNAWDPAFSPDGTKIAFVRSDGTNDQIYVSDIHGGNVVQVTSAANNHCAPTWSPDGKTIAFNGSADKSQLPTIYTAPATGGSETRAISGMHGRPSYQPAAKTDKSVSMAGANRFDTAIDISKSHWTTAGATGDGRATAKSVVLSRSDDFADALGGSALAAYKQGPLLLTATASLTPSTQTEIQRVLGNDPSATVYLLGGTGAISQSVENAIKAHYTVVRIAGTDRYATSIDIANAINPNPDLVLAATGRSFPDALGAGAAAGSYDFPGSPDAAVVILTNNASLPAETRSYLTTWTTTNSTAIANGDAALFGVGGPAATATDSFNGIPLSGDDRYITAVFVAEVFFSDPTVAGVAGPQAWPDALAGGALLAQENGPLLLAPFTGSNFATDFYLQNWSASLAQVVTFGGGFTSATRSHLGSDIAGPGGFTAVTNPTTPLLASTSSAKSAAHVNGKATTATHRTPAQAAATARRLHKTH